MSVKRLKETMSVQSVTYNTRRMNDFIKGQFNQIESSYKKGKAPRLEYREDKGNIYITKGDADVYPCVVAHTDTVHPIQKDLTVFYSKDRMFAMDMTTSLQTGIGGDDKVGIFVALECLRNNDAIKVAFFRDEEHGCLGSAEADMTFFEDVSFVLQCDRQKYVDFVRNISGNELFDDTFSALIAPTLKKFGKQECLYGGITDVGQLRENGLEVCCANISCGYYRPHMDDEYIKVSEVIRTKDFVQELIESLDTGERYINTSPLFDYKSKWGSYGGYDNFYGDKDYEKDFEGDRDWDFGEPEICETCGSEETMFDKHEFAHWCFDCGEYFGYFDPFEKPSTRPEYDCPFNEDLMNFPVEVVEAMVLQQVLQGNVADTTVFEKDSWAGLDEGGFKWGDTQQGKYFWRRVIEDKDFEYFFENYSQEEQEA